jgi:hypothetical protein
MGEAEATLAAKKWAEHIRRREQAKSGNRIMKPEHETLNRRLLEVLVTHFKDRMPPDDKNACREELVAVIGVLAGVMVTTLAFFEKSHSEQKAAQHMATMFQEIAATPPTKGRRSKGLKPMTIGDFYETQ